MKIEGTTMVLSPKHAFFICDACNMWAGMWGVQNRKGEVHVWYNNGPRCACSRRGAKKIITKKGTATK